VRYAGQSPTLSPGLSGFFAFVIYPCKIAARQSLGYNRAEMHESAGKTIKPHPLASLSLFVFFFCLYALTLRGVPTGGDALGMFLVTESLVEDGNVTIEDPPPETVVLVPGADGLPVSKYGIGQSLAELPAYYIARYAAERNLTGRDDYMRYFVTSFTTPVVSALAMVLLFFICLRLGYGKRAALAVTLLAGVCSLVWPHSRLIFSEPLQALALLGAVNALLVLRGGGGAGAALAAGFFAGLAVATKPVLVFTVIPFGAYFFYSTGSRQGRCGKAVKVVAFVGALAMWAAVVLGYNYLRYGGFFETGYLSITDRDSTHGFNVSLLTGLHGLLFSSGKGLVFYTPLVAAAAALFPRFARRRPAEAWLVAGLFAVYLLTFSCWYCWHGDYTWGPRFLVPVVPLLLLPLGEVFAGGLAASRGWKAAVAAVAAVSLFVQIPGVAVNYNEYLRVVRHQAPFDLSYYAEDPDTLELRDNLLSPHYVPEFSPIAGHYWLLKHMLLDRGDTPAELKEKMKEDYPWKGLVPYAPPQNASLAAQPDFWWFYYVRFYPVSKRWVYPLAGALAALLLAGAAGIIASAWKRAGSRVEET